MVDTFDLCQRLRERANRLAHEGKAREKRWFRFLVRRIEGRYTENKLARESLGNFLSRDVVLADEGLAALLELEREAQAIALCRAILAEADADPFG